MLEELLGRRNKFGFPALRAFAGRLPRCSFGLLTLVAVPGMAASGPPSPVTFNRDVAPLLFKHCATCHRPDQVGPFDLLTYSQAKGHAGEILTATRRREMPPWPPEPGYGRFVGERRLTGEQLGVLERWVEDGLLEGDPADLPPMPVWPGGWLSGEPDLVVTLPQAYTLPAEGRDKYRNIVLPVPLTGTRYVKGVEFRPGNARVIHHAFINVDETRQSRYLAGRENPPGFDGMDLPESAVMPAGQMLGWQPGKVTYRVADGLSWVLRPNTDLVVQMHLRPSGRPEEIRPSVGLYFTEQPPTRQPYRIRLVHFELNIPPDETNYVVEQRYVLPVDVSLLRVNPHAHYLGKDIQGYALLPGGEKRWLLWIRNWDINCQGDYEYAEPIELPKGATLVMRYTYDNSRGNPNNPRTPPVWVRHGPNATDEMAALGFQALTHNEEDRQTLARDSMEKLLRLSMDYDRFLLRLNPDDVMAHVKLARILGSQDNSDEAMDHLKTAIRLNPAEDKAHYEMGYLYLRQNKLSQANEEFIAVIRLNPQDAQAFGNLGLIALKQRRPKDARTYLQIALRLNPGDPVARQNLELVRQLEQAH